MSGVKRLKAVEMVPDALSAQALKKLQELRSDRQLCDGVLKTADGSSFPVHRVIVAKNLFFNDLFSATSWSPLKGSEVLVPGMSGRSLGLIIDFLYSGSCRISSATVEDLLAAAIQVQIAGLVELCCRFIVDLLAPENCIEYERLAQRLKCPSLETSVWRYILFMFPSVEKTQQFLQLNQMEVKRLLSDGGLNVNHEELVFDVIVRWIQHDLADRGRMLCSLLGCVRFGLTSYTFVSNDVWNHTLVLQDPDAHAFLSGPRYFLLEHESLGEIEFDHTQTLTRPREPHHIVFSVGGWSGGSPISSIETYDMRTDRWFLSLDVDSRPRAYHSLEVVDQRIYMLGGFDGTGHFNSVRCFDPLRRTWTERACMYSRRCYVSTCVLEGKIYALGGSDGRQRLKTCERYDPATNQWEQLPDMHSSRSDASAAVADGRVYIAGGFNGLHVLDSVEVYDPRENLWTFAYAMNSPRSGVSLIHHGDSLYALGGFDGERRLNTAERLVIGGEDYWQSISSMLTFRSNFACIVLDGSIVVMGGFNGTTTISSVERYDEVGDRWSRLTDMHIHRSALAACVVSQLPNAREYSYLGHYDPL